MPASWTRFARCSIPLVLLRQATGSQKTRPAHTNIKLATDTPAASKRVNGDAIRSRQIAALEITRPDAAAAVRAIREVKASRSATLSNIGPPGRNEAAQRTASTPTSQTAAAQTRTRVSLLDGRGTAPRHLRIIAAIPRAATVRVRAANATAVARSHARLPIIGRK